jgi:hypothetical protein
MLELKINRYYSHSNTLNSLYEYVLFKGQYVHVKKGMKSNFVLSPIKFSKCLERTECLISV